MRRLTPFLLVGVLAIVGCGSSSNTSTGPTTAEFKTAFSAQKTQLKALGEAVGAAVQGASSKTDAQLTTEFQGLASRATALAGSLGQLNAPTQFKPELSALQSSLTQVAGTLHSIEAAAAANDATAAKQGGETIVADALQVKEDDNKLSAKLGLPTSP